MGGKQQTGGENLEVCREECFTIARSLLKGRKERKRQKGKGGSVKKNLQNGVFRKPGQGPALSIERKGPRKGSPARRQTVATSKAQDEGDGDASCWDRTGNNQGERAEAVAEGGGACFSGDDLSFVVLQAVHGREELEDGSQKQGGQYAREIGYGKRENGGGKTLRIIDRGSSMNS